MLTRIRKLNVIYDPYIDDKIGEAPKASLKNYGLIFCITTAHNSRAAASALASLLLKCPE
jgi:hypothetical protein